MTEQRLIDANELKRRMLAFATAVKSGFLSIEAIIDRIDTEPTVDAVEVVRCKDCKHFKRLCEGSNVFMCMYTSGLNTATPDNFCSHGERRMANE